MRGPDPDLRGPHAATPKAPPPPRRAGEPPTTAPAASEARAQARRSAARSRAAKLERSGRPVQPPTMPGTSVLLPTPRGVGYTGQRQCELRRRATASAAPLSRKETP